MLLSTYMHDYVPPNAKRYEFLVSKQGGGGDGSKQAVNLTSPQAECECDNEHEKIKAPAQAYQECNAVEWTGIAPMGKLVDPRLIPGKLAQEQADNLAAAPDNDCFKIQPNRFLKILRTVYPDLYERLKVMPKEELNRRLERNRSYTTYQIDYCNMNEYPEGVYESLKTEDESSKINASKLLKQKPPCAEFRANVMQNLEREQSDGYQVTTDNECEKAYTPMKTSFADASRFINSGNNSHWRANPQTFRGNSGEGSTGTRSGGNGTGGNGAGGNGAGGGAGNSGRKVPNFTEYMDSISRNGCIIMRNKLHDHSKCLTNYCRHELKFMCTDMTP